jgi:hypothetical protein
MGYYSGIDRTKDLKITASEIERARADGIDIVERLREEGYEVDHDMTNDILDIFDESGHRKHYGEMFDLWLPIAQYVNEGAIVYFDGEGGDKWRIVFRNGRPIEERGTVVYS